MTIPEEALYRPVSATGPFAGRMLVRQVRIADWALTTKRIDLVCLGRTRTYAIELKVSDWRRAVGQAFANLYVADYSYVGLWHGTVPRADLGAFRRHGIGLLEVTKRECRPVVRPKRSALVIPERRDYVRQYCEGMRDG